MNVEHGHEHEHGGGRGDGGAGAGSAGPGAQWVPGPERVPVRCTVNGTVHHLFVEPRRTALDVLRDELGLTGTHAGCEHGVCGACTVLLDGEPVRSCLLFGAQLDGASLLTVEGLAEAHGALHPLQESFSAHHGLQCGFCTPGMLLTALDLLAHNPTPTAAEVREAIGANLCRCTGYQQIVEAVLDAARGGTYDCT